jgi:exosortase F-associated protein
MNMRHVRWLVGIGCTMGLVLFFLVQQIDIASVLGITNKTTAFIVTKTIRFVVNDLLMIGVIYALFAQKRLVYFALVVQAFGIVFLLIPYFVLKLYFQTGNGPLVSFLHRLVLNPTLMLLLIPAFWLQERQATKASND